MPDLRNALLAIIAVLGLALAALPFAVVACAPSAPSPQVSGQAEPADATPENAATATATATATTATATATATSAATPTHTPVPAANADNLGPVANALIALQAAPTPDSTQAGGATGASGAAGAQATPTTPPLLLPQTLTVHISTLSLDATRSFLEANNGSIIDNETLELANNWVIVAEAPLVVLSELSQQPDTLYAFVEGPYRNMPSHLNRQVMEYAAARLTPAGAAAPEPESVLYEVRVSEQGYGNVRRFLQTHNVTLTYTDDELKSQSHPGNFELSGFPQLIPVRLLGQVSELPGVLYIDEDIFPVPDIQSEPIDESQSRVNHQTTPSEASNSHGADAWHTAGITGRGVKVGIIDTDFYGYDILAMRTPAEVPMPSNDQVRCYTSTGTYTDKLYDCGGVPGKYHGTAVAEALINVAPDATLYISNAKPRDLESTVLWMVDQGVKVINHSVSYRWDSPGDGSQSDDSKTINAVNLAVANGIVWVNSAGNQAETTWFSRNYSIDSNGFIIFDGSDHCNNVSLHKNTRYYFQMRWAGNWDGRNKDLSIELWDIPNVGSTSAETRLAYSTNSQTATVNSRPIDYLAYTPKNNSEYCLRLKMPKGLLSTGYPSWIQVNSLRGSKLEHNTSNAFHHPDGGSISNPAEGVNAGMLAVGAAYHSSATKVLNSIIETYSSRGPLPASTAIKPEIVGSTHDVSETYTLFSTRTTFGGTSAAAPHVAGLAALVIQHYIGRGEGYTPQKVVNFLKDNAQRRNLYPAVLARTGTPTPAPSINNVWGHGYAYLPTLTPTPTPRATETPTPTPTPTLARRPRPRGQGRQHPHLRSPRRRRGGWPRPADCGPCPARRRVRWSCPGGRRSALPHTGSAGSRSRTWTPAIPGPGRFGIAPAVPVGTP